MKLFFTKMQSCGNDYIYVDCMKNEYEKKMNFSELSKKLSRRKFSIGADGIILICRSVVADAKMVMYNADSSEGKMCGNGIRCVAKYLYEILKIKKNNLKIETKSGIKEIKIFSDPKNEGLVSNIEVNMGKAEFSPKKIAVDVEKVAYLNRLWYEKEYIQSSSKNKKLGNKNFISDFNDITHKLDSIINFPIAIENSKYFLNCVSMGNPHCVLVFTESINSVNLEKIATDFENSKIFLDGVNIEIINVKDKSSIDFRVWERGSQETLSCGTGACASFAVLKKLNLVNGIAPLHVNLKGGELTVFNKNLQSSTKEEENIFLSGPAEIIYSGFVNI